MTVDNARWSAADMRLREMAAQMIETGTDATEFSARFFGQSGELSRLATSRTDRERIVSSMLYRWLKDRYEELRLRDAAQFERDTKAASGRLTVTVPKSLHAALKSEASAEGVSLSELIRLKLSIPYRQVANLLIPTTRAK